ncbi:hypothetical protein [Rhizobium halophilum]|uniref:hypothetical protein n=1 Tax=Rhizobium halophilum TaxID=2846852 RepID=UPI001EFD29B9|nr:hypothetical protein [Rhizobium halophilum]MCF6370982.1 hypothetical protein [Rhizobium halophilum]
MEFIDAPEKSREAVVKSLQVDSGPQGRAKAYGPTTVSYRHFLVSGPLKGHD